MKLKNNDPGKISAKSDHGFKSYGQKNLIFCQTNFCFGTVLEPDQLPGSRVHGLFQLPGSGYPVPDKPRQSPILLMQTLIIATLAENRRFWKPWCTLFLKKQTTNQQIAGISTLFSTTVCAIYHELPY